MKKIISIRANPQSHWVGNGFPVRSIFSYNEGAETISPFLLMDYAGPANFPPTDQRLGVGEHPHRGFETVTIVFDGEVEHRDSGGGGGIIRQGDVQWMTEGSGLVHDEFHGSDYAKRGGNFEMLQLWINLPGRDKMAKPRYQGLLKKDIPEILLPGEAGSMRIIAGSHQGVQGPALTFSPINLWDIKAHAGKTIQLKVPSGYTTGLFVLSGNLRASSSVELSRVSGSEGVVSVSSGEMAIFERKGDLLNFDVLEDSRILLINGEPLNEPVVGYGPFVMNTEAEIHQAIADFQSGKMGSL